MANQDPEKPRRLIKASRWVPVGALIIILLLIGVYDGPILIFLTALWQKLLSGLGLRQQAEAMQNDINGGITKRFLPAVVTYAGLYLSTCLLLLRLLLPATAQWHLVLRLYFMAFAVYVGLVVLAKVVGNAEWAYRLSRQILDFVVSPLPVAGLYVLFQAGFGPSNTLSRPGTKEP